MTRNKSKQPNVGAWLGGNKGYLRSGQQSDQTSAVADAGGGQMESVRGELGLGAYTVGIGTTAAIGAGVAAVRSGRVVNPVAAARNALKGERVFVTGTPNKLKGSVIKAKLSDQLGDTKAVYVWDPRAEYSRQTLSDRAASFAQGRNAIKAKNPQNNVVIVKAKKANVLPHDDFGLGDEAKIVIQDAPILSVVKANSPTYEQELRRALARQGEFLRGRNRVEAVKQKLDEIKVDRAIKRRRNKR